MSETEKRRTVDALWFKLLDRFGLPTLFAVALLGYVLRQGEADRKERAELLGRLATAIDAQTVALREVMRETRDTADVVRAHWPRVRVVTPVPPRVAEAPAGGAP